MFDAPPGEFLPKSSLSLIEPFRAHPMVWSSLTCVVRQRRWPASPGQWRLERGRDRALSKKGITGHDEWVITEALATALVALEQLPPKHQPRPHMEDLRKLLVAGCQPGAMPLHLAQAKCRLFPDQDPLTIYREYGLEDGQH
jgi:hypothetical protein